MADLSDILVKLRGIQDGIQRLTHRDDVKSEPLQLQIEALHQQFAPVINELERYLHSNLMEQHMTEKNSL